MRFTSLFLQASTLHTTHPACIYMIHTTHPACFTPLDLEAVFASHHSSCELHTTRPASLHASHHTACELHTTRPSSMDASHHTSCKPKSFTPHVLQAQHAAHHASSKPTCFTTLRLQGLCKGRSGPDMALVLCVRYPVPPKLSASFIALGSNHRVTTDGVHEARAGTPLPCTDAFHPCRMMGASGEHAGCCLKEQ